MSLQTRSILLISLGKGCEFGQAWRFLLVLCRTWEWIGLNLVLGTHWIWPNGKTLTAPDLWDPGQPDRNPGEDCVAAFYSSNRFQNAPCRESAGFICSRHMDSPGETSLRSNFLLSIGSVRVQVPCNEKARHPKSGGTG